MKNMWDERYNSEVYAYGKTPNKFFAESLEKLNPGRLLLIGEGEGRNAVYAAKLGWEVDAYDFSKSAKEKALKLADESGVKIKYEVADLNEVNFTKEYYDCAGIIFVHLPKELRIKTHKNIIFSLKKNGIVVAEFFDKEQIKYNSGGPKKIELLYSLEDVYTDFSELDIEIFEKKKVHLNEGEFHHGDAEVIRYIGSKYNH